MYRFEGLSRAVWETVPSGLAEPLGAVTALGGASFLMVALAVLYWVTDRHETAVVVSYAFVAIAVVLAVKAAIGLPRPPEAVRLVPLENDPYGFPSGHAVASVVVYGGLATVHDRLSDRRVVAGVATVVVAIGLSRVALGMHYVGDVLAGAVLGVALLAICRVAVADDPRVGFALATVLAVPAVVVTGASAEALLAVGGSLGGGVGSSTVAAPDAPEPRLRGAALVLVGLPVLFGLDALAEAVGGPVATALVYAVLVAGILALPAVLDRVPVTRGDAAGA